MHDHTSQNRRIQCGLSRMQGDAIEMVERNACPSCEVTVLDMNDATVAERAKKLGIRSVPSVIIDGKLADCCAGRGPDEATLRAAGLGEPLI